MIEELEDKEKEYEKETHTESMENLWDAMTR